MRVTKLTALAWLAAASAACERSHAPSEQKAPTEAPAPLTVQLSEQGFATAGIQMQKLVPGAFQPRTRLAGSITGDPTHIAQVGARASGRVTAVRVKLGDRVKRGQALVELDTVELHQTALEYRTAVARARAAQDTLARQRQLVEERVGAAQDLRRAEADAAAADASLREGREHLKSLGLSDADVANMSSGTTESKSRITSPIDGRISALNVSLGQSLTGTETVAVVADLGAVWAQVRVYERDLSAIHVDASAKVEVPSYPNRTFDGKVTFISDVLDPASRSAEVRISLTNADAALRPGMSATASIANENSNGLWLPVTAVQPHDGAQIIFVQTGPRKFEARKVLVGQEQGGFVPIKEGITPNDVVVVQGAFALRGGLERAAIDGD